MLEGMASLLLANNDYADAYFIAMEDPGAGTAAAATLVFAVGTSVAGTIYLTVAGVQIQVGVAASTTPETIATATAAAINANLDLPVTAVVDGTDAKQVNVTCRHKGTIGNSLDIRHSYFEGQDLPSGVTLTVTNFVGGTGEPDLLNAIAGLPDEQYHVVAFPYTDAALLTTMEAELLDRFGPTRMKQSVAFSVSNVAHGAVTSLGQSRNSHLLSIMSSYGSPTPTWSWAAALAGVIAGAGAIDPARPFQGLNLVGLLAPLPEDRMLDTERNLLLYDGIATSRVAAGGMVVIERMITTYTKNALGVDDTAFLDVNSLLTVDRLRFELRVRFGLRYARSKLGEDGGGYGVGQKILTPKGARAEVIALFDEWLERGLVEGPDQFAADLIVERNALDPNRLDIHLSPNLMNGLRVVGAQISFLR